MDLTTVYLKVPEGFVAFVEELPGENLQGASLDEARENLKEAVAMVLEESIQAAEMRLAQAKAYATQLAPGGSKL